MKLLTQQQLAQFLDHGRLQATVRGDRGEDGLCELGMSSPEFWTVSLTGLQAFHAGSAVLTPARLPVGSDGFRWPCPWWATHACTRLWRVAPRCCAAWAKS